MFETVKEVKREQMHRLAKEWLEEVEGKNKGFDIAVICLLENLKTDLNGEISSDTVESINEKLKALEEIVKAYKETTKSN